MKTEQRRGMAFGLIFVALGILFLLEAMDVFEIAPTTLWPILLISLGIGVLAGVRGSDDETPGT